MREIHGHEGSSLSNQLKIEADDRDANGGSHNYSITLIGDNGQPIPADCGAAPQYLHFQNGPLKEAGLNGISDESLLTIVIDRLQGFQTGPFRCDANDMAIRCLEMGRHWLLMRTAERRTRGVEGTHEI